jgi:hypothetical protein
MRLSIASPLARFYLRFVGLLLNLAGAVLISLELSFPSSRINLFTVPPGTVFTLIDARHLKIVWLGLTLIVISSFLAMLSMTYPRSSDHDQQETKTAEKMMRNS